MTGLFLLLVVVLWVMFVKWLSSRLVGSVNPERRRRISGIVVFVLLLIFPLADEIIGGFQFLYLCSNNSLVLGVDEDQLKNKTVIHQDVTNVDLQGYFLPIRKQHWSYADQNNGEIVISWNEYRAKGGFFIRALGISQTNSPIAFNGFCRSKGSRGDIFKKLSVAVQDRR